MDEPAATEEERPKKSGNFFRSFVIVLGLVALDRLIPLPYYVLGPGGAESTSELVNVAPNERFAPEGDFLLTTVTLKEAHPTDVIWSLIRPGEVLEGKKETLQGLSSDEYTELNRNLVESSKLASVAVALERAGYDVALVGEGAQVVEVPAGAPADGKLRKSDVITSVAGQAVFTAQQASDAIRAKAAGEALEIGVVASDGKARTETVTSGQLENGSTYIGVVISTKTPRIDMPFEVGIKDTPFGGPSAGLAFTLSLLDNLTPGELTGGKTVAVTGTIGPDGVVGPVGGVLQKTYAMNDSKAKLFLVPSLEFEVAKEHADGDVKVVAVDTLDQALAALAAHGGEPLPETAKNSP